MKILLTAAALASLALLPGVASAADLPAPAPPPAYKAPAMVPPAYSWTGFYLNAGGGYGLWQADGQALGGFVPCEVCQPQSFGGKGWIGTVGGGFDVQLGGLNLGGWNPPIVAGVQADYDFESLKGTLEDQALFSTGPIKETGSWAAGVRIGLVPFPQMLTYINGGVTGTRFSGANLTFPLAGAVFTTNAFWKTGWFLGGGTETTLSPLLPVGWFLRSEYRYSYFGTTNIQDSLSGVAIDTVSFKPTVQTLTTSLIYKFNFLN